VARAEAYLRLDLSNRLATVHQRPTSQTGQDNGPTAQGEPFYKRSPQNSYSRTDKVGYTAKHMTVSIVRLLL